MCPRHPARGGAVPGVTRLQENRHYRRTMADQRHVLAAVRLMFIPLAAVGTYLLVRLSVEGALGVALALVLATAVSLLIFRKAQRDRG